MAVSSGQPSGIVRAAIYTRISSDSSGLRAGVERQRADCEALCGARGWEVGGVHEDNDCSAYGASLAAPTSACWRRWSRATSMRS